MVFPAGWSSQLAAIAARDGPPSIRSEIILHRSQGQSAYNEHRSVDNGIPSLPGAWVSTGTRVLYSWLRERHLSIKINYLYVLRIPLEQKFHTDSKTGLKKSGHEF